jgi:outer membrane protein TolC
MNNPQKPLQSIKSSALNKAVFVSSCGFLYSVIVTILIIATLTSCVVGPDYKTPVMPLPEQYKNQSLLYPLKSRDPALKLDSWWMGFQDPELIGIIERVLAQNLDLAAAIARVQQGRAAAGMAGSIEMPQGSVDSSVSRQHQSLESPLGKIARVLPGYKRDQTLESLDMGSSWELDLAGGLKRNAEAAHYEAQVA